MDRLRLGAAADRPRARRWVRHMLLPDKPELDAYLADYLPDGLTGRVA